MEQGILKLKKALTAQKRRKMIHAILGSIGFHLLLMLIFSSMTNSNLIKKTKKKLSNRVELIEKAQLPQQIVELLQPDNPRLNKDAEFMSDRNTFTQKQTRQKNTAKKQKSPQKAQQKPVVKKKYNFSLSPQYILNDINQQQSNSGAPQNYLPDIDFGQETLLNAQKFKYASFFIRMKQQLENIWSPRSILFRQNLDGQFYNTKLSIRLDQNGNLLSVNITDSSGSSFLDEEAIRSVQKAAPFLNPPTQLLDQKKQLYIPSWSFIISKY